MSAAPEAETPSEPRRVGLIEGTIAAALLVFWVSFSHRFEGIDPDLFWHLKYGQLILSEHHLFSHDVFSWSAPGAFWLNQEWGGQVVMAWLYGLGGLGAIQTFHWLLFCATLAVAFLLFRRAGWGWAASAGGAVVLHFLMYGQTVFRLQNFTTAFMLVTMLVLQRWWLTRRLDWAGWAYPALVVLWANLHGGGAIAAPVTVGLAFGAETLACLKTRRWRDLVPLAYLAAGACLALLVNPEGWHLPAHSLATLFDPTVKAVNAMVLEWHPVDWRLVSYRIYALAVLAVLAALAIGRRWPPLGMVAVAAAWGAMAMVSRRNLALAPIALAPLAAFAVAAARDAFAHQAIGRRVIAGTALGAVGAAVVALSPMAHRTDLSGVPPYPSSAAIKVIMPLAAHHRMMNFYEWGGLFIFLGYPDAKVFIDGRAYLYGPKTMQDYNDMMNLRPDWKAQFAHYGADMVVAPPFIGLVQALAQTPGWRVVFSDDTAVVVVKAP